MVPYGTNPDEHLRGYVRKYQLRNLVDPKKYKAICQRPDVFSRRELRETRRVLRAVSRPEVELISAILSSARIEKPSKHAGGPETDYFRCGITLEKVNQIVEALCDAEAAMPEVHWLASLVDRWTSYAEHLGTTAAP